MQVNLGMSAQMMSYLLRLKRLRNIARAHLTSRIRSTTVLSLLVTPRHMSHVLPLAPRPVLQSLTYRMMSAAPLGQPLQWTRSRVAPPRVLHVLPLFQLSISFARARLQVIWYMMMAVQMFLRSLLTQPSVHIDQYRFCLRL